jgi:hypothetical protein
MELQTKRRGGVDVGQKRSNPNRDLIQFRAPPAWIDRVNAEAERLGLSLSAYIRLCVNERLENAPPPPTKGKGK